MAGGQKRKSGQARRTSRRGGGRRGKSGVTVRRQAGRARTPEVGPALSPALIAEIVRIVEKSKVVKHVWPGREVAKIGYVNGMACTFASFYVRLLSSDKVVAELTKPRSKNVCKDVLAWYGEEFENAGMDNSRGGAEVLRHLFVFMFGLGMRESSGSYCRGRVQPVAGTGSAETAPAGLFQTSFQLRTSHPLLTRVIAKYSVDTAGFLDVFREDVVCKASDWENYGAGKGLEFQRLTKACPAFAVEYAGLVLRHRRDHWQTVTQRQVPLVVSCDRMLRQVQGLVDEAVARA